MQDTIHRTAAVASIFVSVALLAGCSTAYYAGMEKLGYHKRDLLVGEVEDARDAQQAAKEQFKSALQRFSEVVEVDGGELEATYHRLAADLDVSEARAHAVHEHIDDVEETAEALFDEWEDELKQYTSKDLQRSSKRKLDETKARYNQYIAAMKRAEAKIDPVLATFRDQVLFLKHNLNAKAVASLQDDLVKVEGDVGRLIRELEAAINEADSFISSMEDS